MKYAVTYEFVNINLHIVTADWEPTFSLTVNLTLPLC